MTGEDRRPKIEGVEEVEALYTCFARMVEGDAYHVLKFHGLTERIDLPIVKEGVLPTKAGEVALLSFWARDHGLELGDRIRLKHDGPVEGDRDGMERLTADSFVVTALVVLLNLDVMFVEERKHELLVLMANGSTTGEAKAYIYRDTLALTAMGIPLGIAFGALMGAATVRALEPSYGSFIKGFNALAALVGAVGATTLSLSVLFVALRRIDRFDLTDVNRL